MGTVVLRVRSPGMRSLRALASLGAALLPLGALAMTAGPPAGAQTSVTTGFSPQDMNSAASGAVQNLAEGNNEVFELQTSSSSPTLPTSADPLASQLDVTIPKSELTPAKIATISSTLSRLGGTQRTGSSTSATVMPNADNYGYGATLQCAEAGHYYSWSDRNGTLSEAYQCSKNLVNWGFKISPSLCSAIVGPVNELGMAWYRNGKRQPNNAGHPHSFCLGPVSYHYHGTFRPVAHGDTLNYGDVFKFDLDVGGGIVGPASLTIHGKVHLVR